MIGRFVTVPPSGGQALYRRCALLHPMKVLTFVNGRWETLTSASLIPMGRRSKI